MQLTFDNERHIFTLDGVVVPSVTGVLKAAGLVDYSAVPPHFVEQARQFGSAGHYATQLYDQGNLDYDTLDPALRPYLDSWIKFREYHAFVPEIIEQPMGNKTYMFGGIPDRIGKRHGIQAVVEIKSTAVLGKEVAAQTAGQVILWKGKIDTKVERWAVRLTNEGLPEVVRYKDASDFSVFLAALTIANTKKKWGLL